jgi:flagellar motor switch protein FliN
LAILLNANPRQTPIYTPMSADVTALKKLEVPVIVLLGQRRMHVREVLNFSIGTIIELPKNADADLELLVNNKPIGLGRAVKVGENFGLRLVYVGDLKHRLEALDASMKQAKEAAKEDMDAEALAAAMLAGQV